MVAVMQLIHGVIHAVTVMISLISWISLILSTWYLVLGTMDHGPMDPWAHGSMGPWAHGAQPMGPKSCGPGPGPGPRSFWARDPWAHGPMDPGAHGSMGPWSMVSSTKYQVLSTKY